MRLRVCSLLLLFMALSIDADEIPKKKVLIYNPHIGYYHTKFMATIANELHAAGHDVVMLDSVVDAKIKPEKRREGIKIITVKQNAITGEIIRNGDTLETGLKAFWGDLGFQEKSLGMFSFYERRSNFSTLMFHQCEDVVKSKQFKSYKKIKFDLAITELFDFCGVGLFHLINPARTILASSVPLHEHLGEKLGLPKSFDVVPTKFSMRTPEVFRTSFGEFDRSGIVQNAIESSIFGQEMFGYLERYQTDIFKGTDNNFPGFVPLLRNAHLLIENVHPLLDLSKPTLNSIIPIGGITYQKNLSFDLTSEPELMKDIEAAKSNNKRIVLVSFGTVMDPQSMKDVTKSNFIRALENVSDATFFWKANKSQLLGPGITLPNNVKTYDWLPQNDLLASGDIDLFVSHMGMGSMTEAAYSGVPLVAIPIFVDQHYNYICAKRLGITLFVDKASLALSPDDLKMTIRRALDDKKLKITSSQLKNKLKSADDPRKKMMKEIHFVLSLPAYSTSWSFHNHHHGFSLLLIIRSLVHLVPYYAMPLAICTLVVGILFISHIFLCCLFCCTKVKLDAEPSFTRVTWIAFAIYAFLIIAAGVCSSSIPDYISSILVYPIKHFSLCQFIVSVSCVLLLPLFIIITDLVCFNKGIANFLKRHPFLLAAPMFTFHILLTSLLIVVVLCVCNFVFVIEPSSSTYSSPTD